MKNLSFGTLAVAGVFSAGFLISGCSTDESETEQMPNILFFLVDDMGWQDTSVPFWDERTNFNGLYHTPNMERLAAEGMKFTQAYACAVCSPTRTSLMTGMNAARHGVTNWTLRRNTSTDRADDILEMPSWKVNGLQPVDTIENSVYATNLVQLLKEHGYFTIHSGKAHWGAIDTPGSDPVNLGFDINIAGHAAGGLGSYHAAQNFGNAEKGEHTLPWGVPGLEQYHGDTLHLTDVLTLEAVRALDHARETGKPFYLYMSHYTVHTPIEPHSPYYKKYSDMGLEESEARYASMLEGMDASLGTLMDYLDEHGLLDNTIILFMSDNGGLSAHARAGDPHTHNWPLNSGKGSAYEGGIRVPMIVSWPGVVEPGSVNNDYLIIEDYFPTILEMAQVENYQTIQQTDGVSFVPRLRQEKTTSEDRNLIFHYPNKWGGTGPGIGTTSTIRSGDWKLVYWYKDQRFELFNVAEDIGEKNNLAEAEPAKVTELAAELGEYLRSVDADRPSFKLTGKPVPWPDEAISFNNQKDFIIVK
ncbi:MAG: sulfatase [Bacteroidales bacterium]